MPLVGSTHTKLVHLLTITIARRNEPESLFYDIAGYILELQQAIGQGAGESQEENVSKKRKLEHRPIESTTWDKGTFCTFADISFSIPQRKKLKLELSQSPKQGLRATNHSGDIEFALNWESVKNVVCLPVPEKAQSQYNFCIFVDIPGDSSGSQALWTVPDTAPKDGVYVEGPSAQPSDTYRTLLIALINTALKTYNKRVIEPQSQEFASQIVQAHRKGETAFHIKAFRGSKDGYLFLLSTGIIWGFKKPLEYFSFDSIDSVSYTSVLQRTFNLNIAIRTSEDASIQEFEFSMIDQADFAGIDAYIKRHQLQDASMAEQRRAKKLNINGVKGAEVAEGTDDQEEGELEKARREAEEIEDEEEEEDENFDPGSEGESEGSGESSEEGGEGEDGEGGDLVEQELGSEAEDVDEDEDE